MYNKLRRTMIMLNVLSDHFPVLGGDEESLTFLRVVVTTSPTICAFHLSITVKRETIDHSYNFSSCFTIEKY